MSFSEFRQAVAADLHRYTGGTSKVRFARLLLLGGGLGSFQFVFWLRTCAYTRTTPLLRITLYPVARLLHRRYTYRYGIDIHPSTPIGPGLRIGHFGGIVVNDRAVIGRNVSITQGVTIGQVNRGRRQGVPTVGDGVYIGPGAKVIGAVRVGSNVAIGANAVVVDDVPDDAVVVGNPGRVINHDGAAGYIVNTDY